MTSRIVLFLILFTNHAFSKDVEFIRDGKEASEIEAPYVVRIETDGKTLNRIFDYITFRNQGIRLKNPKNPLHCATLLEPFEIVRFDERFHKAIEEENTDATAALFSMIPKVTNLIDSVVKRCKDDKFNYVLNEYRDGLKSAYENLTKARIKKRSRIAESSSCTGTLVSKKHILTAAHCLVTATFVHEDYDRSFIDPESITLFGGSNKKNKQQKLPKIKDVTLIGDGILKDITGPSQIDMALIELKSEIRTSTKLHPINPALTSGDLPVIQKSYGWGVIDASGTDTTTLRYAQIYVSEDTFVRVAEDSSTLLSSSLAQSDEEILKTLEILIGQGLSQDFHLLQNLLSYHTPLIGDINSFGSIAGGDSGGPLVIKGKSPKEDILIGVAVSSYHREFELENNRRIFNYENVDLYREKILRLINKD